MAGNWQSVFKNSLEHRAEIVKAVLEEYEMNPIVINKTVSAHGGMGDYEILVSPDYVIRALKIIKEDIKFE